MSSAYIFCDNQTSLDSDLLKPRKWLVAVDLINRLALTSQVVMAVLAEQGGGKTSFVKLLLENADKKMIARATSATLFFSATHIVRQIAQCLELPWDASLTLADAVASLNTKKRHFLMIIDEAHFVSQPLLQELLQLIKESGEDNYFHLCLFADFTLTARLRALDSDHFPNMIYSMVLGDLSEQEAKTWVLKNIILPLGPSVKVDEQAIKLFYQRTQGNVALINSQKDEFFHKNTNYFGQMLGSFWRKRKLGFAGIYDIWQQLACKPMMRKPFAFLLKLTDRLSPSPAFTRAAVFIKNLLSWPVLKPKRLYTAIAFTFLASLAWQLLSLHSAEGLQENKVLSDRTNTNIVSARKEVKYYTSSIPALTVASVRSEVAPAPLRTFDSDEPPIDKLVVMDSVVVIPKVAVHRNLAPRKAPTETKLALASPTSTVSSTHHYTIQLVASQSKKELERFIKKQRLGGKVKVRSVKQRGATWFILTMGDYNKKSEAVTAMKRLSHNLALYKPWVRTVSAYTAVG